MPAVNARNHRIRLIHIAKRDLDLDDERYRAVLEDATGKTSSSGMTLAELEAALRSLKRLGWAPKRQRRRYSPASRHKKPGTKTQADKIRAMWINLHQAGVVRDPSEAALCKFCKRLTGKHSADWLDPREAVIVIEALKAWARNEHVAEMVEA